MTEDELTLWDRYDTARDELILFYEPIVELMAKRIAWGTGWANWEDLKQEGIIGLMKAIVRFDPRKGESFKAFAKNYIRGEIYDSSELTRDLARKQQETCRKIRLAEEELTKTLQRNPTIDELAENTRLTKQQIENAIDAMGVAFAGEHFNAEDATGSNSVQAAEQETAAVVYDVLTHLNKREQTILCLYYWADLPDKEIAEKLGLNLSNITKIRQRAIEKLGRLLDVKKKGGDDEERRSGK